MQVFLCNSARSLSHLSKRKAVDGIWFLGLIAYVYTADTCLNLLVCVQVYEPVEFRGKQVSNYIPMFAVQPTTTDRSTILMDHLNVLMDTIFRME